MPQRQPVALKMLPSSPSGPGIKVRGRQPSSVPRGPNPSLSARPATPKNETLFHPWTPCTGFSSVSEAKGVRSIVPASVPNHYFHSFGCARSSSAPKMLGQAFVQAHKGRRWLLKEQILHSIFTPDDIAFIPKIAPDRLWNLCVPFHLVILQLFTETITIVILSERVKRNASFLGCSWCFLCTSEHDFFTPNQLFHFLQAVKFSAPKSAAVLRLTPSS